MPRDVSIDFKLDPSKYTSPWRVSQLGSSLGWHRRLTGMEAIENGKGLTFRELAIWFVKICETPVKFKMNGSPENQTLEKSDSFWKPSLSGSMLNFGVVVNVFFIITITYILIEIGRSNRRSRKKQRVLAISHFDLCIWKENTDKRNTKKSLFCRGFWQKNKVGMIWKKWSLLANSKFTVCFGVRPFLLKMFRRAVNFCQCRHLWWTGWLGSNQHSIWMHLIAWLVNGCRIPKKKINKLHIIFIYCKL